MSGSGNNNGRAVVLVAEQSYGMVNSTKLRMNEE